jgi:alcohol dehydrogenase (cytochrome c)
VVQRITAAPASGATIPAGADRGDKPGDWTLPGRDYANTRYSALDGINVANVKDLKIITAMSTGSLNGNEGQPLVVGNTMYVVTPFPNILEAIDLAVPGGALKWSYAPNPSRRAIGIACCDVVNRGASYAAGRIVYNTLDAQTVAVDAATGREAWKTRVGDINTGETFTMAPLVVGNKVYVGNAGGELGVRGYLAALDLATGKVLWKAYSTGPDADVRIGPDFHPFYAKDRGPDLGTSTWVATSGSSAGARSGVGSPMTLSSTCIYYSTGNPGVWNPDLRPGDNKWSITLFARDPETGNARWAYQFVPHDAWDYDEIMENVLVDMPVDGRMRQLLIHPGRTGFVYTFDRGSGELLAAGTFQPVNWATGVDLATGEHAIDPRSARIPGSSPRTSVPRPPAPRTSSRPPSRLAPVSSISRRTTSA